MTDSVYIMDPMSFRVIDYLNALGNSLGTFRVINPETSLEIKGEVLNLNMVGISVKSPKKKREFGFPDGRDDEAIELFEVGAQINLTPIPPGTLKDVQKEAWEMLVEDADEMDKFIPIADMLGKEFGVTIVLNPFSKDDDSKHLDPVPANPEFPDGPMICKILPRSK